MAELAIRDDAEPASITFGEAEPSHDGNKRFIAYLLAHVAHVPLVQFNNSSVERLAQQLMPNASAATKIRQLINPIIAVARSAKKCGLIDFDVKLTRPRVPAQKAPGYFQPDQLESSLKSASPHLRLIVRFAIATALGPKTLDVQWEHHLSPKTGVVSFRRSKKSDPQQIRLPAELLRDLLRLPYRTGCVSGSRATARGI